MESPILEDSGYEALRKCALIAEGFLSGSSPSWKAVEAKPILLNPWNSGSLTNFPYSPETHNSILGMTVWVPINPKMDRFNLGGGWSSSRLRFYTDDDSPHTFQYITSRLRLKNTDSPQTFSRLQNCILTCEEHHPDCRNTLSGYVFGKGEKPTLPTRVIDIGLLGSGHEPRLILSNGARDHYVALSHCWGGAQHPPPKTSKDNVADQLNHIPWSKIPKTFADAMKVTRELGLRYIWIDSLCILQGDAEDWRRESRRMGSVYEGAYLVVAAADASDSSGGCFFEREENASTRLIEIPYLDSAGLARGSLYVGPTDNDATADEYEGPLAKRAWITQEWILARHMAFFTRKGMVWSCKSIRSDMTVANRRPDAARRLKWPDIIVTHASRNLTYFTDRLISLDGIRTEIEKGNGYRYMHGVFENEMQSQLIWRVKGDAPSNRRGNPIQAPSWSWVSSVTEIEFLREVSGLPSSWGSEKEVDCGNIRFDGDAIIVPAGRTRKLRPSELKRGHNDSMAGIYTSGDSIYAEEPEFDTGSYRALAPPGYELLDREAKYTACCIRFDEGKLPDLNDGPFIALDFFREERGFCGRR